MIDAKDVDVNTRNANVSKWIYDPYNQELGQLSAYLAEWLSKHCEKIKRAYINTRNNQLLFVIIRSDIEFDADFGNECGDLDLAIANHPDFEEILLDVIEIPFIDECDQNELYAWIGESLVSFRKQDFSDMK